MDSVPSRARACCWSERAGLARRSLYLAAAGVGTIGLVDFDAVDLSNLQRQILHGSAAIGSSKIDSARDRLRDINPNVRVESYETRLTSAKDRKSTRLNSSHLVISYAVFCLKKQTLPYLQALPRQRRVGRRGLRGPGRRDGRAARPLGRGDERPAQAHHRSDQP